MTSTWHEARVTKNDQRSKCQARVALPITLFGHFLLSANVSAQADPTIEWEVYNRFPFYKDANAFKDYSSVALKEPGEIARGDWVLATEDRLQDSADAKGWAAKNFDTSKYNEPGAVCWNAPRKEYDICGGDPDYITPKSHVILATVQGTDPCRGNMRLDLGDTRRAAFETKWFVRGDEDLGPVFVNRRRPSARTFG